jgi:hypothetical protein
MAPSGWWTVDGPADAPAAAALGSTLGTEDAGDAGAATAATAGEGEAPGGADDGLVVATAGAVGVDALDPHAARMSASAADHAMTFDPIGRMGPPPAASAASAETVSPLAQRTGRRPSKNGAPMEPPLPCPPAAIGAS